MEKNKVFELIKKELKVEKGSGKAGLFRAGDITEEQVKKIAFAKFGSDKDAYVSQVKGSCRSMGVSIGMGPVGEEEFRKATEREEATATAAATTEATASALAAPVPVGKKEEPKKKRKIRKGK